MPSVSTASKTSAPATLVPRPERSKSVKPPGRRSTDAWTLERAGSGERDVAVRGSADRGLVSQGHAQQLLTMTKESEFGHVGFRAYARSAPGQPATS